MTRARRISAASSLVGLLIGLFIGLLGCAEPKKPPAAPRYRLSFIHKRIDFFTQERSDWLGAHCRFTEAGGSAYSALNPTYVSGNEIFVVGERPEGPIFVAYHCPEPPPWPREDLEIVQRRYDWADGDKGFRCSGGPADPSRLLPVERVMRQARKIAPPAEESAPPSNVEKIGEGAGASRGADDFVLVEEGFLDVRLPVDVRFFHHRRHQLAEKELGVLMPPGSLIPVPADEPRQKTLVHPTCADRCMTEALTRMTKVGDAVRLKCMGETREYKLVDAGDIVFVKRQLGLAK